MDNGTFRQQMDRLKRAYGDHCYPEPCVTALWIELNHVNDEKFVRAITRILATNVNRHYPPGVDKIEQALSHINDQVVDINRKQEQKNYAEASKILSERGVDADDIPKLLRKYVSGGHED